MAKQKPAHHQGSHQVRSEKLRAMANANPWQTCWRCGETLAEHKPHKNGRPARWQAGHINPGQVNGPLAPEASTCNASEGASRGNRQRAARQRRPFPWSTVE